MDFLFLIPWVGFLLLVIVLLALDLGVLNRKVHVIGTAEALRWTALWITLALLFAIFIYFSYDNHWFGLGIHDGATETASQATIDYITGYFIEKTLSLDNIAVMAMIMASFGIPLKYQHRVLFWGILAALVFRGIMIGIGAALVSRFEVVLYIFGALLIVLAVKSMIGGDDETDPKDKWITRFLMKHFRYTGVVEGMHFLKKVDGKTFITPLLVGLIVIELSDVIFAIDSIPAIFGITTDPYLVFTSNIFAILGLRSLYFVLASIIERFRFLKVAIGIILLFVGVKLLIPAGVDVVNWVMGTKFEPLHLPNWTSLATVLVCVAGGIVASVIYDRRHPQEANEARELIEARHRREDEAEKRAEEAERGANV